MSLYVGISIAFIFAALLHLFFKTKAMKSYFPKGIFLSSTVAIAIMAAVFTFNSPAASSPQMGYINSVVNDVPVENSFIILGNNIAIVKDKLKDSRIKIKESSLVSNSYNNSLKDTNTIR